MRFGKSMKKMGIERCKPILFYIRYLYKILKSVEIFKCMLFFLIDCFQDSVLKTRK